MCIPPTDPLTRASGDEMPLRPSDAIEVKRARGKGRGVFARRPIRKGEMIERVPVIVLPAGEVGDRPGETRLYDYCFE